jgi:hypothetical protein
MARRHHKTQRRSRRHSRMQRQRGGAFGIDVAHAISTASGAPLEGRASLLDGAELARPGPSVAGVGGVLQAGGRRRRSRRQRQRGGACGCMGIQRGGASGTGGFSFTLTNELGKVYADLPRGSCNLPQRGGAAPVGASESAGQIVSNNAGFGYGPSSVFESKDGSAHFLEQLSYGRAQAGGRRHRSRKHRHSRRCSHKKQSRRQRS